MDKEFLNETAKRIIELPNDQESIYDEEYLYIGAYDVLKVNLKDSIEYFNEINKEYFKVYSHIFWWFEGEFCSKEFIDCLIKNDMRLNANCYDMISISLLHLKDESYKQEIINSYLYNETKKDMEGTIDYIKSLTANNYFYLRPLFTKLKDYFNSPLFDDFLIKIDNKNNNLLNKKGNC